MRLSALLVPVGDPCMTGFPTYGTCSTSPNAGKTLTAITNYRDAAVQIFTGAVPGAAYPITATCDKATGTKTVTFTLHTNAFGNCDGGSAPSSKFFLGYVYAADQYGHNIDAGGVGTAIPLEARMYFLREGEEKKTVTITCDSNTGECEKTVGSNVYSEDTQFETASVTFGGEPGTTEGNGIFTGQYQLQAGVNNIAIHGTAKSVTPRHWTRTGCDESTIICSPVTEEVKGDETFTVQVYGVAITVPSKLLVMVDQDGYTVSDIPITYTIAPADYQAATAYVAIMKRLSADKSEPLLYIPGKTQGTDTVTLSRGFWFDINGTYEAQVVLNYGTGVEIRSNPITLEFSMSYIDIEKKDPEFPDIKLRWNDYYPALGDKTIVIRGTDINGNDLNGKKVSAQVEYPIYPLEPEKLKVYPVSGTKFVDGRVAFKLSAAAIAPSTATIQGDDFIKIRFDIFTDDGVKEGEIFGVWNVKNNSNTTLAEVLAGEAVFVYDESTAENHIGKTPNTVTDDGKKKFDFVQELLNQVVPRKRSVGDANYTLIDENGQFNNVTVNALELFKQHFKVDNDAINESKNSFNKLKKDYGFTDQNMIIDKETLVGVYQRDTDVLINETTTGDTGLNELYDNVVKKFVQSLMNLENSYRINANPTNALHQWVSRTGQILQTTAAQRQAIAYSYGGRQTISQFNTTVSKHGAPSYNDIENNQAYSAYQNYQGNIGDALDTETNPILKKHGIIGGGSRKWPGLYQDEYLVWYNNQSLERYYHENWAGLDCIGFALHGLRYADDPGRYAQAQSLIGTGDTIIPGVSVAEVCGSDNCGTRNSIHTYVGLMNTNVQRFFDLSNDDLLYYWERTDESQELIHKGDFVRYGNTHISLMYSERWGMSKFDLNQYPAIQYDIIHAYGSSSYHGGFSRKVIITGNDIRDNQGNIIEPSGFGRIKLW